MRRSILLTALLGLAWASPSAGFQVEPGKPKAWAVVVGVGKYPEVTQRDISCPNAVADARAVAGWLTTKAGWPSDQVRLMTSDLGPGSPLRPSLANLDAAFSGWLRDRVKPGDLIFLYFAGQALSNPEPSTVQPETAGRPRDFLLPVDFRLESLEQTGWAPDRALEPFYGKDVQVFCCLDTSTSGRGTKMTPKAPPADRLLKALSPWPGWAAWIASDNGEVAPDRHQGISGSPFRHRLLEALGSAEDPNNLMTCLGTLKADDDLRRSRFRTQGRLNRGLTLWSGRVEPAEAWETRPVLIRGHGGAITGLVVRADGEALFSSGADSTVKVWKPGARPGMAPELERTLTEPIGGVSGLAISPDGRRIVAGSATTSGIWLWDSGGRNIPLALDADPRRRRVPIRAVGFLADSRNFVTVNQQSQAYVWNIGSGKATLWFDSVDVDREGPVAFATRYRGPESVAAAALDLDGKVRLLFVDPREKRAIEPLGPGTTAVDLSDDGQMLAVGGKDGRCAILDLARPTAPSSPILQGPASGEPVTHLKLLGDRWLAVGTDAHLRLFRPSKAGPAQADALRVEVGGVRKIVFSDDGRLLAAIVGGESGFQARVWRLDLDGEVREIRPEGPAAGGSKPAELAFAGRGLELLEGLEDGSIRSWTIDQGLTRVVARARVVAPDPSQIKAISPSPDGRRFVVLCEGDKAAFLFDFDDQASTRLKHTWNSIGFLPDGRLIGLMAEPDRPTPEALRRTLLGAPVVYDLGRDRVEPGRFPEPEAPGLVDPRLATWRFDRMTVSGDGGWIAATRGEGADRIQTYFWEGTGRKAPVLRHRKDSAELDRIGAVGLDRVGPGFVTCAPEAAILLGGPGPDLRLTTREIPTGADDPRKSALEDDEFTAAAFAPRRPGAAARRVIALGTGENGVVLWSPDSTKGDKVRRLPGDFRVKVESLTFTDDGRWLVATGRDKWFTSWEFAPSGEASEVAMAPAGARHEGAIRDIRAWPGVPMVASTGNDATVRFWNLERRQLVGTLAFSRAGRDEAGTGLNWVAFSPDGRFDCPPGGKDAFRLVRQGQSIRPGEATESYRDEQVLGRIREARVEPPRPDVETLPPNLVLSAVSPIGQDGASPDRAIWLEVVHDSPGRQDVRLEDLRLYRDNVPVGGPDAFQATDDPRRHRTRVTLRKGDNTFRAVAGRDGASEGSSGPLPVRFDGDEGTSRVHVLAIGIDEYPTEELRLNYAVRDANDIRDRLRDLDVAQFGEPDRIVARLLKNDQVNEPAVRRAFRELKQRVKDRPEDKIVIFLAGHTEEFGQEFGLLLNGNRPGVRSILKYSLILQELAQLDAGQRLVIVDACQTDKILAGGKARELARRELRAFAGKSLKYPTQYILASKAGEPALESNELQHGLLTYALLCGLGGLQVPPRLQLDPQATAAFARPADEDGDGVVSTDELNRYASTRLPLLAAAYPESKTARGKAEDAALRVPLSFDPTNASFGLVRLPGPRR